MPGRKRGIKWKRRRRRVAVSRNEIARDGPKGKSVWQWNLWDFLHSASNLYEKMAPTSVRLYPCSFSLCRCLHFCFLFFWWSVSSSSSSFLSSSGLFLWTAIAQVSVPRRTLVSLESLFHALSLHHGTGSLFHPRSCVHSSAVKLCLLVFLFFFSFLTVGWV